MKGNEDVFDKRIWALLSGQLRDAKEIKGIAQVLNDEFIPRVIGVLRNLGVDQTTAEEIAMEAIYRAANTYQPGRAKFLTFVTRIALNVRIDKFRQGLLPSQSFQSLDQEALRLAEAPNEPPMSDGPNETSEFIKKVNSVAPLLSQEDRILIQFDIQGVPKESYMQRYNISDAAYRQRKTRAYERLRDLYNERHSKMKGP
jgi:DNA-directed RNA polymerase specialized sigma24 family protein